MEMVDLSTSLDIELNLPSEFKEIQHKSRGCWHFVLLFLIGQLYCAIYSSYGMIVTELSKQKANMPFLNSFINSLVILIFAKFMHSRKTDGVRFVDYLVPTMFDSLCFVLNQIAYSKTSMASNDLMNSFSIVVSALLSILVFGLKYRWAHYLGIFFTLIGMVVIYLSDSSKGGVSVGDLIGLMASASSAFSLVFQERVFLKGISAPEYMIKSNQIEAVIGICGFIFSSEYQVIIKGDFNLIIVGEILASSLVNMILLLLIIFILQKYGATSFTLISLFSVLYSMLYDVFLFGKPFRFYEVVGYASIITGVVVFHLLEPYTSKKNPLLEREGH